MLTIDNRLESAADRLLDSKRRDNLAEPHALVAWLDAHPADVQRLAYGTSAEKLVVLATHNPYAKWLATPGLDWPHALSAALSIEQSARYLWGAQAGVKTRLETLTDAQSPVDIALATLRTQHTARITSLLNWQQTWLPDMAWIGSPLETWAGRVITDEPPGIFPFEDLALFEGLEEPSDRQRLVALARAVHHEVEGAPGRTAVALWQRRHHPVDKLDTLAGALKAMGRQSTGRRDRLLPYLPCLLGAFLGPHDSMDRSRFWVGSAEQILLIIPGHEFGRTLTEDPRTRIGLRQFGFNDMLSLAHDKDCASWRSADGHHLLSLWIVHMSPWAKTIRKEMAQNLLTEMASVAPGWLFDSLPGQQPCALEQLGTTLNLGEAFVVDLKHAQLGRVAGPREPSKYNRRL